MRRHRRLYFRLGREIPTGHLIHRVKRAVMLRNPGFRVAPSAKTPHEHVTTILLMEENDPDESLTYPRYGSYPP